MAVTEQPDHRSDAILCALEKFAKECHERGECPEDHAAFIMGPTNEATGTFDINFEPKTEIGRSFVDKLEKIKSAATQ